jgi:hypothetical protein
MAQQISDLSLDDLKALIREAVQEAVEEAIEDLVAAGSPEFVASIEEARGDARAGRLTPLESLVRG